MSFLLDQKGPKNQGPTEICLSSLRNSGKTKTRPAVAVLRQFVFLIGISLSAPCPISRGGRQISDGRDTLSALGITILFDYQAMRFALSLYVIKIS